MNESGVERVFIGWDGPVLARAAAAFLRRFALLGPFGIQDVVVVVPGARAGRLFLRDIARGGCGGRPRIVTQGALGDAVLEIEGDGAPLGLLRVIWREAIGLCGDEVIVRLGGLLEDTDREGVIDSLAKRVQSWHRELMGEGITFDECSDRMRAQEIGLYERMSAAAEVEQRYEMLVSKRGVRDLLIERRERFRSFEGRRDKPVALVCTPEFAGFGRRVLERVRCPVVSFIGAPEIHADGFDPVGCVLPAYWSEQEIEIPHERIRFEETEQECAEYILGAVANDAGECSAEHVRLGVTDPSLEVVLEREAAKHPAVQIRPATGRNPARGRVGVLLECLRRHIGSPSFESYAALVRHPDIEAQIDRSFGSDARGWLDELDVFQAEYLPGQVPNDWDRPGLRINALLLSEIEGHVHRLTSMLSDARLVGDDYGVGLNSVLRELYGALDETEHEDTALACAAVAEIVSRIARYSECVEEPIGAVGYLSMVIEELERVRSAPHRDAGGVQLLGWLELPWDDADVCGIMGLNDGYVPGTKSQDVLLSDSVRSELSIGNDRSRLGRDCYLMQVILHSKRSVTMTCARRDRAGSPLVPSRLLLRCDEDKLASLILRVSRTEPEPTSSLRVRVEKRGVPSGITAFPQAPVVTDYPVTSMSVTSFKTYLRSPYLFMLQHVLGLGEREGMLHEIDAMRYGSIVHGVLESFGRSSVRNSADPSAIEEYVLTQLGMIRDARYGKDPLPAVDLQLRLLAFRFRDFAVWQAGRTQQGWRIEVVEWSANSEKAGIDVDGEVMPLRGKIDRIDRHESTGRVCIIDYKTGRDVKSPDKTHFASGRWTDLQLPLYRHLTREYLGDTDEIDLAYVSLPRNSGGVRLLRGGWDADALRDADRCARDVIRSVRAESFGDLGDIAKSSHTSRLIGALTGSGVMHADGGSA